MSDVAETLYNDPEAIWGDDVARRPTKGKDGLPEGSPPEQAAIPLDRQIFAANLVKARTAAGLTQAELAERSGLTQANISHLERGNWEPRLASIMALANALQVEPGTLLPSMALKKDEPDI